MHFDSVEQILQKLEQQPGWEKFREYRQLLKCWTNTVDLNTAKHTRPLYISRQVLWVATSSAVRAQELSFQRYSLLKRLNQQLTFKLRDLRFSSCQWHQYEARSQDRSSHTSQQSLFKSDRQKTPTAVNHPLVLQELQKSHGSSLKHSSPADAKSAVQKCLETLKQRQQFSAICPLCDAPTPQGELNRWNSCYLCTAQKFYQEYRAIPFSESE